MKTFDRKSIINASLIQVFINTVINAAINYILLGNKDEHPVTTDSITAGSDTVLGHGVTTAAMLAVIFTLVGFATNRKRLPGIRWGPVVRLALKNAVYAFGLMVIAGVFWQRFFPGMVVSTVEAAMIAGLIAGVVSGVVNYATLTTLLEKSIARTGHGNRDAA